MHRSRGKDHLRSGTGAYGLRMFDLERNGPEGVFRAPLPGEQLDQPIIGAKRSITDTADIAAWHDADMVA